APRPARGAAFRCLRRAGDRAWRSSTGGQFQVTGRRIRREFDRAVTEDCGLRLAAKGQAQGCQNESGSSNELIKAGADLSSTQVWRGLISGGGGAGTGAVG